MQVRRQTQRGWLQDERQLELALQRLGADQLQMLQQMDCVRRQHRTGSAAQLQQERRRRLLQAQMGWLQRIRVAHQDVEGPAQAHQAPLVPQRQQMGLPLTWSAAGGSNYQESCLRLSNFSRAGLSISAIYKRYSFRKSRENE